MKFIHTADWHLGNSIHSVDRVEEQKNFLRWLAEIIDERNIDALVVSGDIFDTFSPSNVAQSMYFSFLASLRDTSCKNVVIVGGNHDSGNMLEASKDLLNASNIRVVGRIENKELEDLIFDFKDREGNSELICAAVPYVPEIELRKYVDTKADGEFSDMAYAKLYSKILDKAEDVKGKRNIPMIATGHLYAAGLEGRYEGVEKEVKTDDGVAVLDVVGNLGKVHVGCFPDAFDYVALGHIHYKTRVGGVDKVMYSGSPFVMGFDDADIPHYVVEVEVGVTGKNQAEGDHLIKTNFIEVPKWIRFKRVSGTKEEIVDKLTDIIDTETDSDEKKPLNLEIYFNPEDGAFLQKTVDEMIFPEHVRIVSWNLRKKKGVSGGNGLLDYDINSINNIEPEDVVRQLVLAKKYPLTEEMMADMSEEDIKKAEDDQVNKYLPYFLKAFDEVAKGDSDENN